MSANSSAKCQLFGVGVADARWLAVQRVAKAHRNWHLCVFVDKVARRLVRLRFVVVRFEIVQNWVEYVLFLVLVGVSRFFVSTLPFLDHAVTCFAERSCTFRCCKECLISCFAVIYDFLSIIQETVDTSMPVAALIVVYCLRFRVITVNRRPGNPPLSTVST